MKLFDCPHCSNRLYFENAQCLKCSNFVVYDPAESSFVLSGSENVFLCTNATECGCNWRAEQGSTFCLACSLNKIIPDLSIDGNRDRWADVERAKKRAVYSLLALKLPLRPKRDDQDEGGLAFDFLADPIGVNIGSEHVLTGHDNGLITLNVAEANPAEREQRRMQMGETYRTLLGHFRHELGHYYWDLLVRGNPTELDSYRAEFGDERADYEQALQAYYAQGAPVDWQMSHITPYATSHPWEDWAESWAHYLHITDTLEMVGALDLPLGKLDIPESATVTDDRSRTVIRSDDQRTFAFDEILARWLILSEATNCINRCMGLPDLYPFVISETTSGKLRFIHDLIDRQAKAVR